MDTDNTQSQDASPQTAKKTIVPWPPPGLEKIHDALSPAILLLGIGDLFLILPFIWTTTKEREFWSLGPFGDTWWLSLALVLIGILLVLAGLERLFRILRTIGRAGSKGHSVATAFLVAGDYTHDMGFLLQGARIYESSKEEERETLRVLRLVTLGSALSAVIAAPLFMALTLIAGGRGWVGPGTMIVFSVALPLILVIGAGLARITESVLRGSIAKAQADADAEIPQDTVEMWYGDLQSLSDMAPGPANQTQVKLVRLSAIGVVVLALLVVLPVAAASITGALGPVIAAVGQPFYASFLPRTAGASAMSRYRLEPDTSITPIDAGRALHSLQFTGPQPPPDDETLRPPSRTFEDPWFPEEGIELVGRGRPDAVIDLIERARSLSPEERSYLAQLEAHQAHELWSITGRAQHADIIGTRWQLPFGEDVTLFSLHPPNLTWLRYGANAHIAVAALQLNRGNVARAEETIREILSTGLLLLDEGPTGIDNVIGTLLVEFSAEALASLYQVTGREREADVIQWVSETAVEVAELARGGAFDLQGSLQRMSNMVLDEDLPRSLRWEFFAAINTLSPCLNLNQVVFGAGPTYDVWVEHARESLVQRPSDEAFFDLYEMGWFGSGRTGGAGVVGGLARFFFGGSGGMSQCLSRMSVI